MTRAAVLPEKPKEEADRHAPVPLTALSALSSAAKPGCRSVAAVYRPAHRHRQKYACCPAAGADTRVRLGAGASAGSRPATGRDAQAGRAGGGSRDGGQPHVDNPGCCRYRPIPHARGDTGSLGRQLDAHPDGAHRGGSPRRPRLGLRARPGGHRAGR